MGQVEIKNIRDEAFKPYGRVLTADFDVTELIAALDQKEAPTDDVIYVPSDAGFESLAEIGRASCRERVYVLV